jgi:hypothetical protein
LLWKFKKDKFGVALTLLMALLLSMFVIPQVFLERTEVTPTKLIHRREWPHEKYNADIPFTQIESAVEMNYSRGTRGFRFILKNGKTAEFPANTVITAAADMVISSLKDHKIPISSETILPKENE